MSERVTQLRRFSHRYGAVLFIAALITLLIGLNAHHFFKRPSHTLDLRTTDDVNLGINRHDKPFAASDIADLKQGESSSVLLTKSGQVYTSGQNEHGQLGNGRFGGDEPNFTRITIGDDLRIKQIDMTHRHAMALAENGDVYTWGFNLSGQLGNGQRKDVDKPTKVFSGASTIAAGYRFSTALKPDGSLWAWGMKCDPGTPGLAELTAKFAHDISVGGSYYNGRAQSDEVYCLEESNLPIDSITPRHIKSDHHFTKVSAGYGSILMVDDRQVAYGYGCNAWGQLGRGHYRNDSGTRQIARIAFPDGTRISQIDAGFRQGIALDTTGRLWSWGHDERGDPLTYKSNLTDMPEQIKDAPKDISFIQAGHDEAGIIADGGFYAFGDNQLSQISRTAGDRREYILQKLTRTDDKADGITDMSLGYVRNIYWNRND